jgi:DNA-binding NarL/FixJ family response regulator
MIATTDIVTASKADNFSPAAFTTSTSARSIRVWLTDDNPGFRELLEQLLVRSGGFNCELQFDSAESLLEGLVSQPAPDVILLDVEMGGMTGVDALRPIRELAPNARVLIVTSFWDPMYEAQALRDGASAYLIKAHTPVNLVGEIHRALVAPVQISPLIPVAARCEDSKPTVEPIKPAGEKSKFRRFGSWAAQLSSNLFRPAPVSAAGSHS